MFWALLSGQILQLHKKRKRRRKNTPSSSFWMVLLSPAPPFAWCWLPFHSKKKKTVSNKGTVWWPPAVLYTRGHRPKKKRKIILHARLGARNCPAQSSSVLVFFQFTSFLCPKSCPVGWRQRSSKQESKEERTQASKETSKRETNRDRKQASKQKNKKARTDATHEG